MKEVRQKVAGLKLEMDRLGTKIFWLEARIERIERAMGIIYPLGPTQDDSPLRPCWLKKPQYTADTPEVFIRSINTLGLSTRARNRMRAHDIETVGELASLQPHELIRFWGTGKAVVTECAAALEKLGLHLGALEREE
jgi:DNA-directed RNA polymerase, alpha subunit/40 kD subunit